MIIFAQYWTISRDISNAIFINHKLLTQLTQSQNISHFLCNKLFIIEIRKVECFSSQFSILFIHFDSVALQFDEVFDFVRNNF